MSYANDIAAEAKKARLVLLGKGIDARYCNFTADAEVAGERIWAPAQAVTKFQMEQALGDWAENTVREAINAADSKFRAIPFGDNDKTLSEDENFADRYRAGKLREMEFGKRADLLLFEAATNPPVDASILGGNEAEILAKRCLAALEVRSSRTSADRFIAYQKVQAAAGKRPSKMEPSFTIKVEDLAKVYRWIARNNRPLIYIQVFFDKIHALNFIDAFRFINSYGAKLKLEDPARSGKKTMMMPISCGYSIGRVTPPNFDAVHTEHQNGRHDIYARPIGGGANIDIAALLKAIS